MAAVTLGVIGAATAVAGAGASFIQAAKQNQLMSDAEASAALALNDAKKNLEKNYMKGLSIQKEPYELQREAMASVAGQAIEAGQESERGAAATAGRIYQAAQQGQGQVRAEMGKELSDLEKLTAAEESRLRDVKAGISMEEAQGYNQMSLEAQKAHDQSIAQGFGALQMGVQQGIQMLPLYFEKFGSGTGNPALKNPKKIGTIQTTQGYTPKNTESVLQVRNQLTGTPMQSWLHYTQPKTAVYPSTYMGPLSVNQPEYNSNIYNPFNIGG